MREDLEAAVVDFRRRLTGHHVTVEPARSTVAVRALYALSERSREQMYWALRASMLSRAEDVPAFDHEFARFWDDALPLADHDPLPGESPSGPSERLPGTGEGSRDEAHAGAPGSGLAETREIVDGDSEGGLLASAEEQLTTLEFNAYSPDELLAARRLIWQLVRQLPQRRSRRLEPTRYGGRNLDLRETLRTAMRTDTELLRRSWLVPKTVRRSLVLLVDVSGSMEGYVVPLLIFCQAAIRHVGSAEAFTFGTRLTRVTPHLRRGSAEAAFTRATRAVPDWAGGTRIGDSVRAFNRHWGRRGMSAGSIVVIASDGWERGDPGLLARELTRLHHASHALIWINPVAGDPDYQPLVRGMAAALPHVDGFQAANNLRSLQELVVRLRELR